MRFAGTLTPISCISIEVENGGLGGARWGLCNLCAEDGRLLVRIKKRWLSAGLFIIEERRLSAGIEERRLSAGIEERRLSAGLFSIEERRLSAG